MNVIFLPPPEKFAVLHVPCETLKFKNIAVALPFLDDKAVIAPFEICVKH